MMMNKRQLCSGRAAVCMDRIKRYAPDFCAAAVRGVSLHEMVKSSEADAEPVARVRTCCDDRSPPIIADRKHPNKVTRFRIIFPPSGGRCNIHAEPFKQQTAKGIPAFMLMPQSRRSRFAACIRPNGMLLSKFFAFRPLQFSAVYDIIKYICAAAAAADTERKQKKSQQRKRMII